MMNILASVNALIMDRSLILKECARNVMLMDVQVVRQGNPMFVQSVKTAQHTLKGASANAQILLMSLTSDQCARRRKKLFCQDNVCQHRDNMSARDQLRSNHHLFRMAVKIKLAFSVKIINVKRAQTDST